MKDNLVFLNIIERTDKLVRFWYKFQFTTILICFLSIPAIVNETWSRNHIAIYSLLGSVVLIYLLAIIGLFKTLHIRRIYKKAYKLLKGHKNRQLVESFREVNKYLLIIIWLDTLLPILWPISVTFKLLFYKTISSMKILIGMEDPAVEG